MPKRRCSTDVRCSPADSTSQVRQAVARLRRQVRHAGPARCAGAQVTSGRRPVVGADTILDVGDHPSVRRRATRGRTAKPMTRATHTRATSPDVKPMCSRCGTARANARPTTGSPSNSPICAPRSAGPPTHDDLDDRSAIAIYAAFLGNLVEQYEPIGWAEELIEPARASRAPATRTALQLATQCYATGRLEDADALRRGQRRSSRVRSEPCTTPTTPKHSSEGCYLTQGRPDRWVDLCRRTLEREYDAYLHPRYVWPWH